jgi:hypothetical protein
MLGEMIVYDRGVHGWRHFLVCTYMYCISSASERKHEIACTSKFLVILSENFVSWCQTLKNSSASFLCIQETYIISTISKEIQKCVICVWCLDNWSQILSGKPFNTFSMARLTKLQFRLTLIPIFTATYAIFFSLSPFFFSWSVIGVATVPQLWLG